MNRHRIPIQWAFTRKKARHLFDYTIKRSEYYKGHSNMECDFQLFPMGNSGEILPAPPSRNQAGRRIPNIELGGNLVAHSAITEGTRKFFRVQLLGKAQVDVAGIIENFDLIW